MVRNHLCTATLVMLNQLCTWTAKTRAIPSLHCDSFLAKVPELCPVLSSGNATSLYCRAVSGNESRYQDIRAFIKTLYCINNKPYQIPILDYIA